MSRSYLKKLPQVLRIRHEKNIVVGWGESLEDRIPSQTTTAKGRGVVKKIINNIQKYKYSMSYIKYNNDDNAINWF